MSELIIRAILKDEASGALRNLTVEMDGLQREATSADRSLGQMNQTSQKSAITWTDLASKYYLAVQALGSVSRATMTVVEASAQYDTIKVRLDAFEGSAQAGAAALDRLQTLAKQPGLGLTQASSAYASLRALKESGPEAIAIIEAIAKANASMGGGAEEFGRAMNQIQQMLGKGKLMAEDINTISESIPIFRALVMDAFGTTDTQALNAKYSIQELLKGIEEAAAKLPPPGETIRNNMDNIGDAWTRLKASLGDADSIKAATGFLATFIEKLAVSNELARKRKDLAREMRGREGNTWSDVLFGETESEFIRRYMQDGGRTKNAGLIGVTSQSGAAGSYASYMAGPTTTPETGAQRAAREAREEEIEELRKEQKKEAEAYQKWVAKNIEGSGPQSIMLTGDEGIAGQNVEIKLDAMRRADVDRANAYAEKAKKDAAKAREKENDALIRESKEIEKQITDFDRKEAEKRNKIWEDEWRARSALAISYADTLSSTMASAYSDIWVNGRDTFDALYDAFSEMITKMAIEMAARATIFSIFSAFGGGGLLGGGAAYIFGARASGGAVFPGMTYKRNEDAYGGGGEPFRPSTAGTIMPNRSSTGAGGGGQVVNYHFAPGTSRADAGYIVRAIQQGTKERRRTVARGI